MVEAHQGKSSESRYPQSQQLPVSEAYFAYVRQFQDEAKLEEGSRFEERRQEIETKFTELLRTIGEECLQLSEFLIEERRLTKELCDLLSEILGNLKISFKIPSEYMQSLGKARQIELNSEGHLIIVRENGKVDSKLLEDYPPNVIVTVLWLVIPILEKEIRAYRKKIGRRVNLLEKMKHELKNIKKAFSPNEKGSFQHGEDERVHRPLIASNP
ncbi:MAG: hypothetical protein NWE81_04235 [Candidatus Bathyarchaeota archaeon]|jgi:hypothetical protein|nr:hypothetical protein [Candidatus Bathyarchaeota archaeon]